MINVKSPSYLEKEKLEEVNKDDKVRTLMKLRFSRKFRGSE